MTGSTPGRSSGSGLARPVLLVLVVASAASLGCAVLSRLKFEPLDIELQSIRLDELDTRGGALTLRLEVFNPNAYEIRGTRIEADLEVEEVWLGGTSLDGDFVLAQTTHTMLEVPVRFSWEGLGATARSLLEQGSVSYDLETRFRVDLGPEYRNLRFRRSGEVDITGSRR